MNWDQGKKWGHRHRIQERRLLGPAEKNSMEYGPGMKKGPIETVDIQDNLLQEQRSREIKQNGRRPAWISSDFLKRKKKKIK